MFREEYFYLKENLQSPGVATVPLTILFSNEAKGLRPQPGELI